MAPREAVPPQCAAPVRDMCKPKLALPAQAADCHAHVFGPKDKYPYAADAALHAAAGLSRRLSGDACARPASRAACWCRPGSTAATTASSSTQSRPIPGRLRGIALIGEDVTDKGAAGTWPKSGIRGFRVNRTAKTGPDEFGAARPAGRTGQGELGWHVQFLLDVEDRREVDTMLGSFATEVVIDHMGRPDPRKGVGAPGLPGAACACSRRGVAGPSFRAALLLWRHHAVRARAGGGRARTAWCGASTGRMCCWRRTMPNDGDLIDQIAVWVPEAAIRQAHPRRQRRAALRVRAPLRRDTRRAPLADFDITIKSAADRRIEPRLSEER